MRTVYETEIYRGMVGDVWSTDEQHAFIDWISSNPDAGDLIPGTGGLRKVRYQRAGTGKRSGARVIHFTHDGDGEIWLLAVYSKAKYDNIPAHTLVKWKEAMDG